MMMIQWRIVLATTVVGSTYQSPTVIAYAMVGRSSDGVVRTITQSPPRRHSTTTKTTTGITTISPHRSSASLSSSSSLKNMLSDDVEAAIVEAQQICHDDPNGPYCQVAWDIVEELGAANSHLQQQQQQQQPSGGTMTSVVTSMDVQALMASFDLLTTRLDTKMDQLIATCNKFEEWGADPSVVELSQLAQQMKVGMAYVKNKLNE